MLILIGSGSTHWRQEVGDSPRKFFTSCKSWWSSTTSSRGVFYHHQRVHWVNTVIHWNNLTNSNLISNVSPTVMPHVLSYSAVSHQLLKSVGVKDLFPSQPHKRVFVCLLMDVKYLSRFVRFTRVLNEKNHFCLVWKQYRFFLFSYLSTYWLLVVLLDC